MMPVKLNFINLTQIKSASGLSAQFSVFIQAQVFRLLVKLVLLKMTVFFNGTRTDSRSNLQKRERGVVSTSNVPTLFYVVVS